MALISRLLFGPCVRALPSVENKIYLTFDDGPDPETTVAVLDLLAEHDAKASFFMVARQAEREGSLARKIVAAGHAIGNHSLDHRYGPFFGSRRRLQQWICDAEKSLTDVTGGPLVGFRPPAGVRTPPLGAVLAALREPMVLWSMRFYDAVRPWREPAAKNVLGRLNGGDIILLHDRQRAENREIFLQTLDTFLSSLKTAGVVCAALERPLCVAAMQAQGRIAR